MAKLFDRSNIRVCHLITDLNAGGAERMLVNIVSRLDRSRFTNDVVSMIKPGILAEELRARDVPFADLGMQRGRPTISGFYALVRHIRRSKPHVLQTWLYHADLLGTMASHFAPAPRLLWNLRCSDLLDMAGEDRLSHIIRALAWMSGRPDAVVVNSKRGKEFHRQAGYHPRHWIEIPNGVDVARFRPNLDARKKMRSELRISPQTVVIGLVARFHPMKDHATFLQAAALFASRHRDCRFVLCGEGINHANQSLSGLIDKSGLGERLILLGVRGDMEMVYPAFDLLTLSSAFGEGFPNVLIEAMACGVPCVATDVGDSRQIIGDAGLIAPPKDATALADSWHALANAAGMADRGRQRVEDHYSIERICALYENAYEKIASRSIRLAAGVARIS